EEILVKFLIEKLKIHRERDNDERVVDGGSSKGKRCIEPLIVGIQGPQGIGKSTTTEKVSRNLRRNHRVTNLILSLDDFYLTYEEQRGLESKDPSHKLIRGRGLPGTHDTSLLRETLDNNFNDINDCNQIRIPIYDKSLHEGLGDRRGFKDIWIGAVDEKNKERSSIDLVILEGWMVGFLPIEEEELRKTYHNAKKSRSKPHVEDMADDQSLGPGDKKSFLIDHGLDELVLINDRLKKDYYQPLWTQLNLIINLVPKDLDYIWEWRLQQEHEMKAKNGGIGMADDQVKQFISRYMPMYELY
ncbi:P-loop containing nucleoside triphosphate hydrolase protein, partial [Phakopsora pachyrhizi]